MKAVILPFREAGGLAPLRSLCPDFLLPLADKPVVEHLIEQLVSCGVTDITLLCDDRPDAISRHFGYGERWGCTVTCTAVREGAALHRLLAPVLHGIEGPVLCVPGNLIPASGLESFLASAGDSPTTICCPVTAPDSGLLIAAAALLSRIAKEHPFADMTELTAAARASGIPIAPVAPDCSIRSVALPADLLSLQRDLLEERVTGFRIPARKAGEGIWIGSHTIIASGAVLTPPVMIGSYSRIIGDGRIGPNTVIGSQCLVNNSDLITESILLSGTAAGPHTEFDGLAARGGALVNLKSGVAVTAPDAFILGGIGAEADRLMPGNLPHAAAALLLLLLLAPLALPLYLLSLVIPGMSRLLRLYGNNRQKALSGGHPREQFTTREFTFGPLLLRRWPGLVPVLTGNLLLVGAQPSTEDTPVDSTFEIDAPRGLFRIWEVDGDRPESEEERTARENYHAVTRTVWGDLGILLKAAGTAPPPSR